MDFVYSGYPTPVREGAFYNTEVDGIQRHFPDEGDSIFVLDSDEAFFRALRTGAEAFYGSYWRYSDPSRASGVKGRDLVWSLEASEGGLSVARKVADLFMEVLEEEGFPHPLVKYSGKLGFDIMIPLEDVQTGSPDDLGFLTEVHRNLTNSALDYLKSEGSFEVEGGSSKFKLKDSLGTCLLTELRWGRGLLLAPMSLHPSSGLVSVPLLPNEVPQFSVVEASPEKIHPREWNVGQTSSLERTESVIRSFPRGTPLRA